MKKISILILLFLSTHNSYAMLVRTSNNVHTILNPKHQNKSQQYCTQKTSYKEKKLELKKEVFKLQSSIEKKSHEITFYETSAILCAIIGMEVSTTLNISKGIFLFGCGASFAAQKALTQEINSNLQILEQKQIQLEELEQTKD